MACRDCRATRDPRRSTALQLNKNADALRVGDIVATTFYPEESFVIRRITEIKTDFKCASGLRISADGGCECLTCGDTLGTPINSMGALLMGREGVDGAWFIPIEEAISSGWFSV